MKNLKTPAIIIAIGLVLCVVACLVSSITKAPTITQQDFAYSVTYKLDGETKTLEGVYSCKFEGHSESETPWERYYDEEYIVDGQADSDRVYTVAQKDGQELYLVTTMNRYYLMGDTEADGYTSFLEDPYFGVIDSEGMQYEGADMPDTFQVELVSWEYPQPVENTFVFSGFSYLHPVSMALMVAIALLTTIACMIAIKRDKTVPYKVLDKISIVLNFAITLVAVPLTVVIVFFMLLVMGVNEFSYQILLCVPAFVAFTVAASVALRRKGFTKSGFFVQLPGVALLVVYLIASIG